MNNPNQELRWERLRALWKQANIRTLRVVLGTGLSLLFLWLAFRDVPLAEALAAFARADYRFVALGLTLVLISPLVRAARWKLLYHPEHDDLCLLRLAEVLLIGQMLNIVVPTRLGELARIYFIGKLEGHSRARTLGTIAVEKWLDVLMLLLLMLLVPLFVTLPSWFRDARISLASFALAFFAAALIISYNQARLIRLVESAARFLPERWQEWVQEAMNRALDSLNVLHSLGVGLRLQGWSLLVLLMSVTVNYIIFHALDMSLPFAAAFFLLAVLEVGVAVPSAPGKLGVFHYLCTLALGFFGVGKSDAIAYAVLLHTVVFVPPSLLGAFFLWWESVQGHEVPNRRET